jgi:hypothetical protein
VAKVLTKDDVRLHGDKKKFEDGDLHSPSAMSAWDDGNWVSSANDAPKP